MVDLVPSVRPPAAAMGTAGDADILRDRAVATAIDYVLCYALLELPVLYVASVVLGESILGGLTMVLSLLVLVPLHSTYAFAFEWRRSRTVGKSLRSLVVVTADGHPPSALDSAVRNLARYLDLLGPPPFVYAVGIVSAARSPRGQRLGDRVAGTVVVRATAGDVEQFAPESAEESPDPSVGSELESTER